ncbi:amino acid ABC transporter substrate-binding protein [Roseospira marina]|uniref:Amino acid ABC transporter substrate-binding protein n=1 Tax=Roseospira marina TaxID=140057 RepID=A0A5M6IAZ5_9PROT|nr:transporter substrate-binding domain-containing protein [Roseospira marina]KAA5605292.1 amino acid ABC transporter substrate-binding protein [Roseospira marina]MBB4314759.1 polar amino acid transport system substrate-binding protein [Roseospira marina]MBB5087748.1 polar amino acid transport system substrate-binding protein [Roseospira marina]
MRWCVAVSCLTVALTVGSGAVRACALTIGWEPWAPYQMEGEDGPKGLDIDLVTTIMDRAGCTVTFKTVPWARLLMSIEIGAVDGAMAAAYTDERAAYAHYSAPYRHETVGLMVRADDAGIRGADSLEAMLRDGKVIGLWNDYYYGETVEALRADPALNTGFHVVDHGRTMLVMLSRGRFDATLGDPVADVRSARDLGIGDKVAVHGLTVLETPVHLLLSKASVDADTMARIDAAIESARADGTLEDIVAGYLGR